jgi:pimeloyl-ACP methyl ester carboxylesterase
MVSQRDALKLDIGSTAVDVVKAGQGDPLVYLHGAFGYSGWHPFLERLAETFTVYAPLQPGFSENNGIERLDDVLDLTLLYLDILEALDLDAPVVVGHFIGGMIGAEMAAIRPAAVGKLVMAAPAGVWKDDEPGVDYFATPQDELRKILFSAPDSSVAASVMPQPQDDEERGQQGIDRIRSLSTVGKFLWPIPDKGLKKRLSRIKCPTLIIVGEKDQIVPPSYGELIASKVAGSRVATLKGTGHMLMFEQPEAFTKLVRDFTAS